MAQDKAAKQAILINVPARGKGRGGRTVQKRKVPTETSAPSVVNDGASTSIAEDSNTSEALPTTKRPAQETPELTFQNQTSAEVVTREGRTEMHFYHHIIIEHPQPKVYRPEYHQSRRGGYGQSNQYPGTSYPTVKYWRSPDWCLYFYCINCLTYFYIIHINLQLTVVLLIRIFKANKSCWYHNLLASLSLYGVSVVAIYAYNIISHIIQELVRIQ